MQRAVVGLVVCILAGCSRGDERVGSMNGERISCPPGTTVQTTRVRLACERDGKPWTFDGPYIEWSPRHDGSQPYKALAGNYVDGRQEGVWTQYHPNGEKYGEGTMRRGKREGEWKKWNERADLVQTDTYDQGRLVAQGIPMATTSREQWQTLPSGARIYRRETVEGEQVTLSVVEVHQRDESMTYHTTKGNLIKVQRQRSGERLHITECEAGKPSRAYWIAGNDTPDHPRDEVAAELATASDCSAKPDALAR